MSAERIDVLAVMDEAALSQSISGDRADMREARAAVADMAHHAERLLVYIDSAHGDQFRELIEQCAAPGGVHIEGLRAALARVQGGV